MLPEEALVVIDHEFAGSGYSLMDARKRTVLALEDAGKEQAQKCAAQVCRQFFTEPAQRLAIAAVATNHAVP
jgi:recombinational DNA repair ATPase RecF